MHRWVRWNFERLTSEDVARLRLELEQLEAEKENLIESLRLSEESRDRYRALYDTAPTGWVTLDPEGVIQELNQQFVILLGMDRRPVVGALFKSLVYPADRRRIDDYLPSCAGACKSSACDVRLICACGVVPVRLECRPPSERGGTYAMAIIDRRELVHVDEERRTARAASAAKDQFIAMLSHELRTPLTPVLAALSTLVERDDIPSTLMPALSMMKRNVVAEARLIDDLLDVTRISQGKLNFDKQRIDVHEAVRQAVDVLHYEMAAQPRTLELELSADRVWVNGDALRLRQVFWNLLKNALKFTDLGGKISIRSWNSERRLVVEVSDDGCGVPPEALPRLFEPFEQVVALDEKSRGGLGLGLAICRGIVALHDANLSAASPGVGRGARFLVEFDTIEAPAEGHVKLAKPPDPPLLKPRLLLVEDHFDTAETLAEMLRDEGYEVTIASSVAAALAAEFRAGDLLVSDLGLPDGSGIDLMQRLGRSDVRAIALSGYGTEADRQQSREAGFSAHLTKPIEFKQLLAAISDVCATH